MSRRSRNLDGNRYVVTHTVGHATTGTRLDRFLMDHYPHRSRERLKKAIDSGAISLTRKGAHLSVGKLKPSTSLADGDIVELISTRRPEPEVNFNYKILYEDDSMIVINKPPNIPVHPTGRFFFNTLLTHLKTNGFQNEGQKERSFFLVHRIDKETSGVLLIAKTREACANLVAQFARREPKKYYLALVHGKPTTSTFTIDAAIGKSPTSKIGLKMHPIPLEKGGYASVTDFEVVETRTGIAQISGRASSVNISMREQTFTLLACFPKTGRQHQIRVHAEIAGYPLVGDKIYGLSDEFALALIARHRLTMEAEKKAVNEIEEEASDEDLINSTTSDDVMNLSDDDENFVPDDEETKIEPEKLKLLENIHHQGPIFTEIDQKLILPFHALHAAGLKFTHPITGKEMVFESELPDDLKKFFEDLTGAPLMAFKTKRW